MLNLKGMAGLYLDVEELKEIFCRELFFGPAGDFLVMPIRELHGTDALIMDEVTSRSGQAPLAQSGLSFQDADMPMISIIRRLDLKEGLLEGEREFSTGFDLWLEDHRPLGPDSQPLVSAIMAVEAILEAARIMAPHLVPLGLEGVQFKDMIEFPPGISRPARLTGRRLEVEDGRVIFEVALSSQGVSPSGRRLDSWSVNYRGRVILGGLARPLSEWPGFLIRDHELSRPGLDRSRVREWYRAGTGLKDRYQVIEAIDGAGPESIRGWTVLRESDDFAGLDRTRYQYSPYLLEALLHLPSFHAALQNNDRTGIGIPVGIDELRFQRHLPPGERMTLHARRRSADDQGLTWDACAVDPAGVVVFQLKGLRLEKLT